MGELVLGLSVVRFRVLGEATPAIQRKELRNPMLCAIEIRDEP